ncbi:MAG: NUDIX hydrolase [Planctomycetaceae bacterium]
MTKSESSATDTSPSNSRRVLGEGRFIRLVADDTWEYAERCRGTGVVGVVAVTDAGELVLTEQFRPSVKMPVIDIPAGLVGDERGTEREPSVEAARRELLEETGWDAGRLEFLARCPTSPGITSETIDLFRAAELVRVADGGGDAHEDITVHLVPLKSIDDWLAECVARGAAIDVKLYAALWFA